MTLDANDFLTYHLYTVSKTPRLMRARTRNWILLTVSFLLFSFVFFDSNINSLGYYFAIVSVVTLIFYPFYSRWKYKRYYTMVIADTYKNRIGEESSLEITAEFILTKSATWEMKFNVSQIEEINEIRDFYFLKLKTGMFIIISKSKTPKQELVAMDVTLRELAVKTGINWNTELNWKWR